MSQFKQEEKRRKLKQLRAWNKQLINMTIPAKSIALKRIIMSVVFFTLQYLEIGVNLINEREEDPLKFQPNKSCSNIKQYQIKTIKTH